jgi:uncharacterized protein YndB with AHSA1/START domain
MSGDWHLNNCVVAFIAAPVEQVWQALTDPEMSKVYFMGATVEVGPEGGRYAVTRDKPDVTGKVLVKEAPTRLRVTWEVEAPSSVPLPNCEVEYLVEPASTPDGGEVTKLTVSEFVDGEVPSRFMVAGRNGWGLIVSGLKTYLESGKPLPRVALNPPH